MDAATQGVEVTVRNSVKPKAKGVLLSGSARRAQLLGNPETALLGGQKAPRKVFPGERVEADRDLPVSCDPEASRDANLVEVVNAR